MDQKNQLQAARDLGDRLIVRMLHGSHLYGTSVPESDEDFKGVFVPTASEIMLQRAPKTMRLDTKADRNAKSGAGDVETELFALHHFMKLACEGQTVALDMLFAPGSALTHQSGTWEAVLDVRHLLVSRSIAPFVGYCRMQANKYGIKGSRMAAAEAALNLVREFDRDRKLGEYHEELFELEATREHVEIVELGAGNVKHLSVCGRKAPYTLRVKDAVVMFEHLWGRYGERARAAKENMGVDWKALMHAVRVLHEARELLTTGHITFPRPEVDLLMKIRRAELAYEHVAGLIEDGMAELEREQEESDLREKPDRKAADAVVMARYRIECGRGGRMK